MRRTKHIFVHSVGQDVPAVRRGKKNAARAEMEAVMQDCLLCSVSIELTSADSFTLEDVVARVRKAAVVDDDELDADEGWRGIFTVEAFREALREERAAIASSRQDEELVDKEGKRDSRDRRRWHGRRVEEIVKLVSADAEPLNWALFGIDLRPSGLEKGAHKHRRPSMPQLEPPISDPGSVASKGGFSKDATEKDLAAADHENHSVAAEREEQAGAPIVSDAVSSVETPEATQEADIGGITDKEEHPDAAVLVGTPDIAETGEAVEALHGASTIHAEVKTIDEPATPSAVAVDIVEQAGWPEPHDAAETIDGDVAAAADAAGAPNVTDVAAAADAVVPAHAPATSSSASVTVKRHMIPPTRSAVAIAHDDGPAAEVKPRLSGYILKMADSGFSRWQVRYVEISGGYMRWWHRSEEAASKQPARHKVNLFGLEIRVRTEIDFDFTVPSTSRVYSLCCDTSDVRPVNAAGKDRSLAEWKTALEQEALCAVDEIGEGMTKTKRLSDLTGKDYYKFGDLTKAALGKMFGGGNRRDSN